MNNLEIYVDYLSASEILTSLNKQGQGSFVAPLVNSVKNVFESHFDSNNKLDSVINFLGPGAVSTLVKLLTGSWWMSALAGLLMTVFHVDLASIIHSVWNMLFSDIKNNTVTPEKIDAVTSEVAQSFGTSEKVSEVDFQMIKIALLNKEAFNKGKIIAVITSIIGHIFKTILTSAGLMAAGDVVNKAVGRPSALTPGTLSGGKEIESPKVISTQSKFKVNPSYKDYQYTNTNWIENIPNTKSSIENMIIGYAKEVYPDLNSMDNLIRSSKSFENVVDQIEFYNHSTAGESVVFIPHEFKSKKQLIDSFIDEVANKAK